MLKKIIFIVVAICFSQGIILAQTNEQADEAAYTLGFSTYLSHVDRFAAFDVYSDSKGFIYVSGNTRDKNFPATPGAIQTELKGDADAFVAKFTPEGKIVFATLIGGTKREHHSGLTVDEDGYIYLIGGTHSDDFPVTSGAYDESFNGEKDWGGDVYLVKLDPSGSGILFSTFIGGSAQETAMEIAIDSEGNIVVAGTTLSQDFPVTEGVLDKKCEDEEGFLAKFSPDGEELIFSTFLGGSKRESVTGLAVDNKGNIFVSGCTTSDDLVTTENAVRRKSEHVEGGSFRDGMDVFLVKVDSTGTRLLYSTYFAGKSDSTTTLSWTSPNKLVVCGNVDSDGFPRTENAYGKKNKGDRDGFVSIFDSDEMELEYSTLFGGNQFDYIKEAFLLKEDMLVVGGLTNSADLPRTEKALDNYYPASNKLFNSSIFGRRKAFVSVIDIKKNKLVYSTYFGACLRFKIFPDDKGGLGFIAEVGGMTFPGMTDFPLSRDAFRSPYTYIMLGRLLKNNITDQK